MSAAWGLQNKPTNNRRNRPTWALNDKALMLKCVGARATQRFNIAQMYWQQNMTALDIATALDLKPNTVEVILCRLTKL